MAAPHRRGRPDSQRAHAATTALTPTPSRLTSTPTTAHSTSASTPVRTALRMPTSGPPVPPSSSASTSPRGTRRPVYVATSSTRCSTSTSCTHLEPCWPPCPSMTSTYSTTWPNTAPTFTRGPLGIAAWLTGGFWDNDAAQRPPFRVVDSSGVDIAEPAAVRVQEEAPIARTWPSHTRSDSASCVSSMSVGRVEAAPRV